MLVRTKSPFQVVDTGWPGHERAAKAIPLSFAGGIAGPLFDDHGRAGDRLRYTGGNRAGRRRYRRDRVQELRRCRVLRGVFHGPCQRKVVARAGQADEEEALLLGVMVDFRHVQLGVFRQCRRARRGVKNQAWG